MNMGMFGKLSDLSKTVLIPCLIVVQVLVSTLYDVYCRTTVMKIFMFIWLYPFCKNRTLHFCIENRSFIIHKKYGVL